MSLDTQALLRSFAVAICLHGAGFFLFTIKASPIPDRGWAEVLLWDPVLPARQGAPMETSSDPEQAIPSFPSLPEARLSLDGTNDFSTNHIKRFRPDPVEDYFFEADKALAKEMDYLGGELDPRHHLPLEESKISSLPLMFAEKKTLNRRMTPGLRWYYQGAKKIEIEKEYATLFELLKNWNSRPPTDLILLVSFTADSQIAQCQIEQSSGDTALDDTALRLFQKNISPQKKSTVAFRGRLTLRWENGHD